MDSFTAITISQARSARPTSEESCVEAISSDLFDVIEINRPGDSVLVDSDHNTSNVNGGCVIA